MTHSYKSIDEVLTGRVRLAIMAFLVAAEQSDFAELQKATEATKGNLGAQIQILEEAGYISVKRVPMGKRSRMIIEILDAGRDALHAHVDRLQSLLNALSEGKDRNE